MCVITVEGQRVFNRLFGIKIYNTRVLPVIYGYVGRNINNTKAKLNEIEIHWKIVIRVLKKNDIPNGTRGIYTDSSDKRVCKKM